MKRIEDLLKSKLSGTKAQADPAMDEALWEKVSSGLKAPTPESVIPNGNSIGWKWAAFGGGFLFVAGIGVGLLLDYEPSDNPTQNAEFAILTNGHSEQEKEMAGVGNEVAQFNNSAQQHLPLRGIDKEVIPDQDLGNDTPPSAASASDLTLDDLDESRDPSSKSESNNPPSIATETIRSTQTKPAKEFRAEEPALNDSRELSSQANEFSLDQNFNLIPPISRMKPIQLALGNDHERMLLQNVIPSHIEHTRPYALRAFGGITLSNFKYVNDNLAAYSDHFFTASSTGAGMALDFDFKNQHWSVGLGWIDYAQRLEFEHTWQTQFVQPEGVISVELDPISGDTLSVLTGPVLVTATHQRHVRDYNHWNAIIVPVEWRKEWMVSRWTLGTGLGGQFQVRTGAQGQTFLDSGSLARFQDADLSPVRISWSPTARFYVGYQIQPEWRVDFSATTGFQSVNARRDDDITAPTLTPWDGRLHTVQISAGVTRYFELIRPRVVK
ncbi:MAG: hypothetical protein O3B11_02960 [Bacteroidetes bacterium]|nr:hypothetical protein [Bacteroidota bacterium]